ncbi:hypothetical protein BDB00DRAFT_867560 [Zychaea mexicana]|uniref:uncharacterized protein n=1 Tax=Zychaea mexicana TaxID=64656 RepID=UPI0022FDEA7D|nr:uncharacterized protein BDB00DRAFT_867560 [Zychaea mexicana]KAI9498404.1 hypothetical protein BDB00DRAFT_867560 [Zychaea mexicana]
MSSTSLVRSPHLQRLHEHGEQWMGFLKFSRDDDDIPLLLLRMVGITLHTACLLKESPINGGAVKISQKLTPVRMRVYALATALVTSVIPAAAETSIETEPLPFSPSSPALPNLSAFFREPEEPTSEWLEAVAYRRPVPVHPEVPYYKEVLLRCEARERQRQQEEQEYLLEDADRRRRFEEHLQQLEKQQQQQQQQLEQQQLQQQQQQQLEQQMLVDSDYMEWEQSFAW